MDCRVNVSNNGNGPDIITSILVGETTAVNPFSSPTISIISFANVTLPSIGETPACTNTVCSPIMETPSGNISDNVVVMSSCAFCKASGWVSMTPGKLLTRSGLVEKTVTTGGKTDKSVRRYPLATRPTMVILTATSRYPPC